MAYASWSVVFGEQPSAAKWNILGTNDASFNDGSGIGDNAVAARSLATNAIKLGYAEITASVGPSATSTSDKDITGLSVTVTVPAGGRDVKITGLLGGYEQSGGIGTVYGVLRILESTTQLASAAIDPPTANTPNGVTVVARLSAPSAGSHTYKLAMDHNNSGPNYTIGASSISPSFILVELI